MEEIAFSYSSILVSEHMHKLMHTKTKFDCQWRTVQKLCSRAIIVSFTDSFTVHFLKCTVFVNNAKCFFFSDSLCIVAFFLFYAAFIVQISFISTHSMASRLFLLERVKGLHHSKICCLDM